MQAPSDYKTSGLFMILSGALTILASLGWIGGLIWVCVGALWVFPLAMGIFEVVTGLAVYKGQYKANAKTVSILGIVAALLCGNVIGIVLEILSVVQLGKPEVAAWMAGGGTSPVGVAPEPMAPPVPPPPIPDEPASPEAAPGETGPESPDEPPPWAPPGGEGPTNP
ncbi:MAG: hypothetical protein JXB39_00750 [Deltaproteobacteria bacterium]|nr:hypothetical protein [Deltaproteobacteria bacterium]